MAQRRYRWKHLIYEDLIICLVSTTEEAVLPVARAVPSLPMDILHHRLDLMLQTIVNKDTLCAYRNRIITYCKKVHAFVRFTLSSVDIRRFFFLFFFIFSNRGSLSVTVVLSVSNGATKIAGDWFSYDCTKLYGVHKRSDRSFSQPWLASVRKAGCSDSGANFGTLQEATY